MPRPLTFSRVIDTYGPAIASITCTPGTPEYLAGLSPRQFADLVRDASRRLLSSSLSSRRDVGADLYLAWRYLDEAVTADGAIRSDFLDLSAGFLSAVTSSTTLP
ncbi:hypothetical protein [Kitasatospora sp. NPDC056731]|uniref:hypothetical protein n=1 Tax=Kitasatospora sp. NPDC056731 TaxID=3155422 RepID=UPI0034353FD6